MPTNEQRRQAAKRHLDRQLERRTERAKRRRTFAVAGSAGAVVLVIGVIVLITVLSGGDDADQAQPGAESPASSASSAPGAPEEAPPVQIPTEVAPAPVRPQALPPQVDCQYTPDGAPPAKPATAPQSGPTSSEGTVRTTLTTSAGEIGLTLDRALAPCAVKNFVSLTQQGYYDQTPCHRLTTGQGLQVLQCGDPTGQGSGGPGYSFGDEVFPELSYGRGYIAMANSGPNTNGSQFFLVYGEAQLDPAYTVFGTIDGPGLQVIDEVARAGNDSANGPGDGMPNVPVLVESAAVVN